MSLIPPAFICAGAIFLMVAGENVARWIRVRRTTADEQALNAAVRRHPSSRPAHIPGQRRPS